MSHILFIDSAALALSATMAELSAALMMGVAQDAKELSTMANLIYSEAVGLQHAYVAKNPSGTPSPVHLELLYKALSLKKDGILGALKSSQKELSHV
jgi:ABC-2 type transport system ATP-binding protein